MVCCGGIRHTTKLPLASAHLLAGSSLPRPGWQECVGRLGSFPHGIDVITAADYFTVSVRQNVSTGSVSQSNSNTLSQSKSTEQDDPGIWDDLRWSGRQ